MKRRHAVEIFHVDIHFAVDDKQLHCSSAGGCTRDLGLAVLPLLFLCFLVLDARGVASGEMESRELLVSCFHFRVLTE